MDHHDVSARLRTLLAQQPPQPATGRFRPLRIGILGIWEYDEQQFSFCDGRLILKGRNGSGKTKVLEVTSPFLFDADLSARRLDPFGTAARSMRDNLLLGPYNHRIGYVWCEYGRIDEEGVPTFITIGAGLHAQRSKSGAPDSWYFVTPQRVDVDFVLMDNRRNPHSRERLTEILSAGEVFQSATSYRAVVAEKLFRTTSERFRSLVELLITLRRPKLSENFGIARLTGMLSSALPPIDGEVVDELARGFDELATDQEELTRIGNARAAIETFTNAYRVYARGFVRQAAGRVRKAVTGYDDVTRRKTAAERQLAEATTVRDQLVQCGDELDLRITRLRGEVRGLEQRPEIEQQALLVQLEKQAEVAEREAAAANRRLSEAAAELERAQRELAVAERALAESDSAVGEIQPEALARATAAGLGPDHELEADRVWNDTAATQHMLTAVISARRAAVAQVRRLRKALDAAQLAVDRAQASRDDAVARKERAAAEILGFRSALETEIEAVTRAVISWIGDCREISVGERELDDLVDLVHDAGEPGADTLAARILVLVSKAQSGLLQRRAEIDALHKQEQRREAAIRAEHERVTNQSDEPPPLPSVPRRDRQDQSDLGGAPLWKLVDFAAEVPDENRARIEAALLGAGLLDAWVTPDGTLLDPETLDVTLRPGPAVGGPSLAGVLQVEPDARVRAEVVLDVLRAIGLRTEGTDDPGDRVHSGPWVSTQGAWSIGPLRGRTECDNASFIGASARAAARARRLAELAEQLAAAEQRLAELRAASNAVHARLARLEEERRGAPDDRPVRHVRGALDAALRQAALVNEEVVNAERRLAARQEDAKGAYQRLDAFSSARGIDPDEKALAELESALADYQGAVAELIAAIRLTLERRLTAANQRGRVHRQRESHDRHQTEAREAAAAAEEARAEHVKRSELYGADVEQVLSELREAREGVRRLQEEQKSVGVQLTAVAEQVGAAVSAVDSVEEERERQEELRSGAVAEFDRLRTRKLLELIGMMGMSVETPSMTRTVDEARRAEHVLQDTDISERSRNLARNNVDNQFRELQNAIGSADWRPWGEHDGDLFLVRITHNGIDYDVLRMAAILDAEIDTRQGLLDTQERELFSKVLVGKVGQHLRRCRQEARDLVDRMNGLLKARPTASGLRMQLVWEVDPDSGDEAKRAVELLDGQAPDYLSDDRRAELIEFLVAQVRRVRDQREGGDWKEKLREALDYRNWCRFRIRVQKPGGPWNDLTDGKHQQGSGGEKAIMLQLPLFVAAAAHYQGFASSAPRPVYLDEAFAGIDQEMRGSCMGLLTDLDLDFVMASHDEWGFHAEVPGVVTYELERDPEAATVLATPYVWDGKKDYRLVDPAINRGPATLFDGARGADGV
ncbi:MAG TPA: TIGR02680 family protein [Pseudonocardiaceae bacterium]